MDLFSLINITNENNEIKSPTNISASTVIKNLYMYTIFCSMGV